MRLAFFGILMVFVITACNISSNKKNTSLTGELQLENGTYVFLSNYNSIDSTKVMNGQFKFDLQLEEPGYFYLSYGTGSHSVFISPKQNLNINLIDANITTGFSGDGSAENNYLNYKKALQLEHAIPLSHFYDRPLKEFRHLADSLYITQKILLSDYMEEKGKFSPAFEEQEKAAIFYDWATRLMEYPQMSAYASEIDKSSYFKFLKDVSFNQAKYLSVYEYRSFLNAYFEYYSRLEMKARNLTHFYPYELTKVKMQKVVRKVENQEVKDYLLFQYLNDQVRFHGFANTNELFMLFDAQCKSEPYRKRLLPDYEKYQSLSSAEQAPYFTMESLSGEVSELSQFEGQYIYIDVWATWCLPCRKEAPYFEELKTEYAGKNVVFLSLSVDRKKEDWLSYKKQKQLTGEQFIVTNIEAFLEAYQIKTIPHFLLIDPMGKVANPNAPRPSSKKRAWLEQLPDKPAV